MTKMYDQRKANISVFRGCDFNCVYCAFQRMLKLSKCEMCKQFKPHGHLEVLDKIPPKTKEGEFLTIGLSGDISFMDLTDFWKVIEYCRKWKDRTFLIQSKNPTYFLRFQEFIAPLKIPNNIILGTTIETNRDYEYNTISKAPSPVLRYEAMLRITSKISITIEPILDFDLDIFINWIKILSPEFCYVGYDSHPEKNRLPEPSLNKVNEFVERLRDVGINVHTKFIRESVN